MVRDVLLEYSGAAAPPRKGRFAVPAPPPPPKDWRDAAEKRADEKLLGNWWRCREHGPTQEPVLLGDAWYCPFDPCGAVVLQVHGAINDPDAVDRATQSSAWRGSAGHRAQRERAGLVPELPPDPRRRRAVEDLEVDRDAPEAVELVHDEETESEGSDASASPPATQKETPMPDPDRIPPSALILDLLRRRAPLTRREITNVVL